MHIKTINRNTVCKRNCTAKGRLRTSCNGKRTNG
ncbi:MAG: hypothetical protein EOO14_00710 [Chitinophagaceae bacterium]|nr:MAG: hypothetical protein EOO14_00710 [Chitinophagaceae bacterium]